MKSRQFLFDTVTLDVVVLLFLTTLHSCIAAKRPRDFETEPSHNITLGERQPGDKLLFNGTLVRKKWYEENSTRYHFYRWPESLQGPLVHNITMCHIEDNGLGGKAIVFSGGPGRIMLELYLQSEPGKGFDFQIIIYGTERLKRNSTETL